MKFEKAVSDFGAKAKAKLSGTAVKGRAEDQLRAPLESLFEDAAAALGQAGSLKLIGETEISDISSRPDYAAVKKGALIGHIEIKAPGKGADPRKFKGHDKDQWEKLKRLPNIIYTDGNAFSLWRDGKIAGAVVRLEGDIEISGAALKAPPSFESLVQDFLAWEPVQPRSIKQLAETSARMCRLLRDEVTEALERGDRSLENLAADWRELLFPKATDRQFADGYAQAVTFGLLMAKAERISLAEGVNHAAVELIKSNSLIGAALRLLTDSPETRAALETSLGALIRVLDAVDWEELTGKDRSGAEKETDAWLYFYEDFLEVYDNALRKMTGSYYTPPEVVDFMVRIVDESLRNPALFDRGLGLADSRVRIADPAAGTGTYLLGVLRSIAKTVEEDRGAGAAPDGVAAAAQRLIGFETQFGPFAVAQLRVFAALKDLCNGKKAPEPRLYITDTLGDPYTEETRLPTMLEPIGKSRQKANAVKREEEITVVIGNPPYKEKARGRGGWIESAGNGGGAPLDRWMPKKEWGAHAKHLYNLYVYFWRWAAWKVFGLGHKPPTGEKAGPHAGIVSFITVAGFLNGDGFREMRADLRRECSDIWVIDCSPEGHQSGVSTRIFQGVQQPVCIVMAVKTPDADAAKPARVRFTALPKGHRTDKFAALSDLKLSGRKWESAPKNWSAPFLPEEKGAWSSYPLLNEIFIYNGSGVMPGRTWVIAPDAQSLERRWARLVAEKNRNTKQVLFHPHLRKEKPGDRHIGKPVKRHLPQIPAPVHAVEHEAGVCVSPVRYAYRSFDRQWIIPDARVINQPNPALWEGRSDQQIYLTSLEASPPVSGPSCTFCGLIPDLSHYKGSFGGRTFPLWLDAEAEESNIKLGLLKFLEGVYGRKITPADMMAYIACVAANPEFTRRFESDLRQPQLRIPITSESALFKSAVSLGSEIIWLHTYGERFYDAKAGRPHKAPRMKKGEGPFIPKSGAVPGAPEPLPERMNYDAAAKTLTVGKGRIENVSSAVWNYEVSGKNVLNLWFSYRKLDRSKPPMGDKRPPSPLQDIQPDHWPPEYTEDLIDLLHVLGRLDALESAQKELLEKICGGPLIDNVVLKAAGAFDFKHKKDDSDSMNGAL